MAVAPPPPIGQDPGTDQPATGVRRVPVLLPMPFAGAFDYKTPTGQELRAGDIVSVPLGNRHQTGVVWDTHSTLPPELAQPATGKTVADNRLRAVGEKLDLPPLNAELRRFVDWVAAYTLSPPGMVLAMTLRLHMKGSAPTQATGWVAQSPLPTALRMTPARHKVLAVVVDGTPRTTTDIASAAGVSAGVVKGLADAGALRPVLLEPARPFAQPNPLH
ncbi:MAG: primosomal protein N', partial [Acetobacter sp.]